MGDNNLSNDHKIDNIGSITQGYRVGTKNELIFILLVFLNLGARTKVTFSIMAFYFSISVECR